MVHRLFRLAQVAGDAVAVIEVDGTRLGQAQVAGGAVQQPRAEAPLQVLHLATHRGLAEAKLFGGGAEAALFHDLGKDQGVVEVLQHCRIPVPCAVPEEPCEEKHRVREILREGKNGCTETVPPKGQYFPAGPTNQVPGNTIRWRSAKFAVD